MEKFFLFVWTACIVVGACFLGAGNVFCQTPRDGQESYTTINAMAASDGNSSYTYVKGITTGRAISLLGGVMGLISLIIGWGAKVRSSPKGAKIAIILGFLAILAAIVHLSTVAGAVFGSGSGKAGSLVALPLAIVGTVLGGLTLRALHSN